MKFVINIVLLMWSLHSTASIGLRFQPYITPQARHLSDVLIITHDTKQLKSMRLDSHPRAGELITKTQVIDWINAKSGAFNYQWMGKTTALTQQETKTTGAELINKAQSVLTQQLKDYGAEEISLVVKTAVKDSALPLSVFTTELPKHYPPTKEVCVRLIYKKQSIPIWFAVSIQQKVLVAKHTIKSHSLVQRTDFTLKKRSISGLSDKAYTQLPQAMWLKKSINKDQILIQSHLDKQPDVIKGQAVQVNLFNHGVFISTEAIAQNDGYIGQAIKMKNPTTNKYFVALITAPHQVEIKV